MDDKEPVANENEITPISINKMVIALSNVFVGTMSPYPTVTIVVTVKYIDVTYNSLDVISVYPF